MNPTLNSDETSPKPREKLTMWHLAGLSLLLILMGGMAGLSGLNYSELSSTPESWTYVADQFRGKRYGCFGFRSMTCGVWLYFNAHEQRVF